MKILFVNLSFQEQHWCLNSVMGTYTGMIVGINLIAI